MMNSFQRSILKIIIIGLFLLIIFLVIFCFIVNDIKNNSLSLLDIKKKIDLSQKDFSDIEILEKDFSLVKKNLSQIKGFFVDKDFPVDIITFWENKAQELDIEIEISSPRLPLEKKEGKEEEKERKEEYEIMEFTININGPFFNVLKFLKKVENSPYFSKIKNISVQAGIKRDESGKEEREVNSNFVVEVYTK